MLAIWKDLSIDFNKKPDNIEIMELLTGKTEENDWIPAFAGIHRGK